MSSQAPPQPLASLIHPSLHNRLLRHWWSTYCWIIYRRPSVTQFRSYWFCSRAHRISPPSSIHPLSNCVQNYYIYLYRGSDRGGERWNASWLVDIACYPLFLLIKINLFLPGPECVDYALYSTWSRIKCAPSRLLLPLCVVRWWRWRRTRLSNAWSEYWNWLRVNLLVFLLRPMVVRLEGSLINRPRQKPNIIYSQR